MHSPADLITTAEAATILRKSVATVNRMAINGQLDAVAQGAGVRGPRMFNRDDVLAAGVST